MRTIDEKVLIVANDVQMDFLNDTIAYVKGEDSEDSYQYNHIYACGRLSALYLVAEGFEAMTAVNKIRDDINEKYDRTINIHKGIGWRRWL